MNIPSLAEVRPTLTPRQAELVDVVLSGETTAHWVQRAYISPKTAEAHGHMLAAKLGLPKGERLREAILRMRIRELELRHG